MSGRRGVLGGLAAAVGIGGGLGQSVGGAAQVRIHAPAQASGAGSLGWIGDGAAGTQRDPVLLRQFREAVDAGWAKRNRMEARLALTHGVPAGILACGSWKPWFVAQAAERWRAEHMPDPRMFERLAWRAVFGEDMPS